MISTGDSQPHPFSRNLTINDYAAFIADPKKHRQNLREKKRRIAANKK